MKKLLAGTILLTAWCGCNTALDPTATSRLACPTLTQAEFDLIQSGVAINAQNGLTEGEQLANVQSNCTIAGVFDTQSECRDCLRAMIAATYGP